SFIDVDSERQNEGYDFSTRMGICYLPDRARPAVLAVRQAGSSERVRMSRGGSDRLFDGRIRINQEAEPLQAASFRRGQWVYDK
ncbi:MAG: hypothetical protein JWO87_3434, partial [Phycisphaerales bacterium]|nr:hypothetical protein [Phycisphaerales bacterium]